MRFPFRQGPARRWTLPLLLLLVVLVVRGDAGAQAPAGDGWLDVDYSRLLDGRRLSHSGESLEVLLAGLAGRGVPAPGERPEDRLAHSLLEPLVEPYGFVMSDALDARSGVGESPLFEIAGLWQPGEAQPAWVELLRARRFVVESDGNGSLRVLAPLPDGLEPPQDLQEAAQLAWRSAWPVMRHVLAAERLRLGGEKTLNVTVHAYRHHPERSTFRLGSSGWRTVVDDLRPDGLRPPLELAAWRTFLDGGLRLEGAKLEEDGAIRLFGSPVEQRPTILGEPITLADMAVAYRAIFHGGLAEPYMSLDRGYSPETALVNYGGRLRDTRLGLVSLLCDVRFKTFSLGLGILEGRDLRAELRQRVPTFRSHTERFAEHPDSERITSQQTRLWFYPDRVDLTVSPQNDVLVLRKVRMSAASERLEGLGGAKAEDPPWTLETIRAIDQDYDALAALFPELGDLDQVVRLLSLFTWLRQAESLGVALPDLDSLLTVDLPALTTPRSFPQLLAFNALPPPNSGLAADVFDRVAIGEGLERLNPADGRPLPPRRRLSRAISGLDPNIPEAAALREEIVRYDVSQMTDSDLDGLAYRAERVRMHTTVLSTLDERQVARVAGRQDAGERLRIFSVGIGGLDLGMGQALARSGSRSLGLGGTGAGPRPVAVPLDDQGDPGESRGPRQEWRVDPAGLVRSPVPEHGLGGAAAGSAVARRFGDGWIEMTGGDDARSLWSVSGGDGMELRSRRAGLDTEGRSTWFERIEDGRFLRYRMVVDGVRVSAEPMDAAIVPTDDPPREARPLPDGLATLRLNPPPPSATGESDRIGMRLDATPSGTPRLLEAEFPRALLQRIAIGPEADMSPGRPVPALQPLPPTLGAVQALMVIANDPQRTRPWNSGWPTVPGEEDPARIARSLVDWSRATRGAIVPAVLGLHPDRSPPRWAGAPRAGNSATLLVPAVSGGGPVGEQLERIRQGWTSGPVKTELDAPPGGSLVLYVSDEPPGICASRVSALAQRDEMQGKLLGVWCLAGPVREDLPGQWLAEGKLSGVGVARSDVVDLRTAPEQLAAIGAALASQGAGKRVEALPGPFLWCF